MPFLKLLNPHHAAYWRLNDRKIGAYDFDRDNSNYWNNLSTKEKKDLDFWSLVLGHTPWFNVFFVTKCGIWKFAGDSNLHSCHKISAKSNLTDNVIHCNANSLELKVSKLKVISQDKMWTMGKTFEDSWSDYGRFYKRWKMELSLLRIIKKVRCGVGDED